MKSIFETKETKLSKDFEIIGNDIYSQQSRKFLKQLDIKMEELGLSYDQCREAAKLFKRGDFKGALIKIWGRSKVKIEQLHTEGGTTEKYIYTVNGYGEFTETITRGRDYWHAIRARYNDDPTPSFPLATVIDLSLPLAKSNEKFQENALKEAFMGRSTAAIYNILFVCMDGYDMSKVLSKYHVKLRNKL